MPALLSEFEKVLESGRLPYGKKAEDAFCARTFSTLLLFPIPMWLSRAGCSKHMESATMVEDNFAELYSHRPHIERLSRREP